jgi:hypothetical protein
VKKIDDNKRKLWGSVKILQKKSSKLPEVKNHNEADRECEGERKRAREREREGERERERERDLCLATVKTVEQKCTFKLKEI